MNHRLNYRRVLVALVMLVTLLVPSSPVVARNDNPGVVPPHAKAFGKSYEEWSAAWWQWVSSLPAPNHPLLDGFGDPVIDPPGSNCEAGQRGNVWFLAGTFGWDAIRSCQIPTGTALFFPILNGAPDNVGVPEPVKTESQLRTDCLLSVAEPHSLSVEIDGRSLINPDRYEIEPTLFTYTVPDTADNIYRGFLVPVFGAPDFAGEVPAPGAVSCGYYVMLTPLTKGQHTIHIAAAKGGFSIDVVYTIDVVPGHELKAKRAQAGRGGAVVDGKKSVHRDPAHADRNGNHSRRTGGHR